MCLYYNVEKTKEIKQSHPETVKAWKILMVVNEKLESPFYDKVWKIGVNKSNRRSTKLAKELTEGLPIYCIEKGIYVYCIEKGIYVYTKKKQAEIMLENRNKSVCFILPVYCKKDDFVGCNSADKERVYTKVTLLEKDYKKILN